ncbi:hypothetical protein T492DRAFT_344245 [Pavlovales sp. CCMP2436]|nr:hypothetical protein T492DRAFT_344245 [Pavlovales sp. CCMP2436]
MVKQAYDDAGLDFAPLWKKVKETSAKSFSFQHLIIDPELTKLYAKLVSAAGLECRTRPEYQLGYNGVYGRMVYQDYMGTIDLVHDLEILRAAIGLEKLSLWGASYGTEVGASYATVYPDRVLRLILDGNVAVSNDIYAAAELWSLSYEQVWNGLAAACDSDYFIEGDIINNNNAFHTTTGNTDNTNTDNTNTDNKHNYFINGDIINNDNNVIISNNNSNRNNSTSIDGNNCNNK